jgi:hypothetical protein
MVSLQQFFLTVTNNKKTMDINTLRTQVKILCDKIELLHPNDDFAFYDSWDELTLLLCKNETSTLIYFEECNEPLILSKLGSVIDYISLMLQSSKFIDLIKKIAKKNSFFWGEYDWVVDSVERMIMPKGHADALKKYKTPSAWEKRNALLSEQADKFDSKISTLHELSTRRPLLVRERFELTTLEKLQKADNLEQLENLKNEVENEATDAQLKTQLLKNIEEKKGFY